MQRTYRIHVAGLDRDLPIRKIDDDLYIASFVIFGDQELTVACAREMLKLVDPGAYDYMLTAEAKGIPLIHEMARQTGATRYFLVRKAAKAYMRDPVRVADRSITTTGEQALFLDGEDALQIRGKRILLMDDVISTGGSLQAMETLVHTVGGVVVDRVAVLAEGGARKRPDIKFLAPLPMFRSDGSVID